MNKKDQKPNYKKLYQNVTDLYKKTNHFKHGPFDETFFTLRVFETAKQIINNLQQDCHKQAVLVAAILHDVGKIKINTKKVVSKQKPLPNAKKEWDKHPSYSPSIAKDLLTQEGYSKEFIDEVSYLIKNHAHRNKKDKNLELKILQDADLMADCGIVGFIRPFLHSGKFSGYSVIDSIKFGLNKGDAWRNTQNLNLHISKKIMEKKIKREKELFEELAQTIDSELVE